MGCQRFKGLAAAFVELAEEFNKLQSVGVHIRAQKIDGNVERVPNQKYNNKQNNATVG